MLQIDSYNNITKNIKVLMSSYLLSISTSFSTYLSLRAYIVCSIDFLPNSNRNNSFISIPFFDTNKLAGSLSCKSIVMANITVHHIIFKITNSKLCINTESLKMHTKLFQTTQIAKLLLQRLALS